ncbi:MAG: COG1361 S-layer family protein [Candidatus Micrarchaeaceae archaeon]
MNKVNVFGFIGIILSLTMFLGVGSAQSINGALSLTNVNISPNPLYSGDTGVLSFQVYDSYSSVLSNVNLQLQGSYPILNFSPSGSKLINSMSQGIYGGSNTYFTYTINVPKNTPSGSYTFDVLATYQTTTTVSGSTETITGSSTMPITIYVYGTPNLNLNGALTNGNISPGENNNVQLSISNSGTGTAYNASISIINSTGFSISGPSSFNIGNININQVANINTNIFVSSNITQGTHDIEAILSYENQNGTYTKITKVLPISVLIQSPKIKISVLSAMPSNLYSGGNQTLTLNIQNIGSGNAKNLALQFENSNSIYVTSSNKNIFLGTLNTGSSETQTISIQASSNVENNAEIPVLISYSSANNGNNQTAIENIPISITNSVIFNIINVTDNLTPGATYVPINVTFLNSGNEPATNVSLSLQSIYPISPVSSQAYISYLGPNQKTVVVFYVSVDQNGKKGNYPITLYEQWKQPNAGTNQEFFGSSNYYAQVNVTSTPAQNNSSGSPIGIIIILIIIIIVAYLIYTKKIPMLQKNKK